MYKIKLWQLLPLLSFSSLFGQKISLNTQKLDFGITYTHTTDSLPLTVYNHYAQAISVEDLNVYDSAFRVRDTAFNIMAGDSHRVYIYFHPRQNVAYNSELTLLFHDKYGIKTIDLRGQGRYKDTYYAATENLSEEDLKKALKTIISTGYVSLGYDNARDKMYGIIDNHSGEVECVYTGRKAAFSTRSGATANNFNAEHTLPQSLFSSNEPMKSDLHHLFPTDETANNKRGNLPFGMVSNPVWQDGGSKLGNGVFEPRDVHKGDVARALLYFVIRYQDYSNFVKNMENQLRQWAAKDTPDAKEIQRNDAIYQYQKNRNPFIDHPEFLERITSITSLSVAPDRSTYAIGRDTIHLKEVVTGDTIDYELPVIATGNKTIVIKKASFYTPGYQITQEKDTIVPGESGYVRFRYIFGSQTPHLDSLQLLISAGSDQKVSIPVYLGTTTAVKTVSALPGVQVYPNPFSSTLHVRLLSGASANETMLLHIYTLTGKEVLHEVLSSTETDIAVPGNWPQGLYLLQLNGSNGVYTQPLMKL